LAYQIRSLSCFPDGSGFAAGSIEGRVSINVASEFQLPASTTAKQSFAFKCHRIALESDQRKRSDIMERAYPINDISWHPNGTFLTAGGDGKIVFWDKDVKQRLCLFDIPKRYGESRPTPIVAAKLNFDGSIVAIASSYDWFKGEELADQYHHNDIYLVKTPEGAVPRKRK